MFTALSSGGGKHMEVNLRAVYGMRAIGVEHKQLQKLCSHMNMPEPMNISSYNKVSCVLKDTVQVIAEKSMADVAEQLKGPNNDTNDAAVSIDGSEKGLHLR